MANKISAFFTVMYQRMVDRANKKNGHDGSIGDQTNVTNLGTNQLPIGTIAVYPDSNTESYIRDAYSANATVYTIISKVARRFAAIPRYVYKVKDKGAVRQYKHFLKSMDPKVKGNYKRAKDLFKKAYDESPVENDNGLTELLKRPNPGMGQDSFYELCDSYFEAAGECIVWLNRGLDAQDMPITEGEVLEMYVMPPQYMTMVPDPYNVWGALGWIFECSGLRIPIDLENIIHIKKPNLNFNPVTREHMRGMSPLRPGRKKLTEDESTIDASVALNQNGGAKGIIGDKSTGKLSPQKETAFRTALDTSVNNNMMRGAVVALQGDLSYFDLSMSSTDMELETRKDNIFDRLCNLIGVPPDLFKTGQTYENMIQARKDAICDKVLPTCCIFRDEFDRVLLPAFGLSTQSFCTDVDATSITELQDDVAAMVTSLAAAWWLTPNEKRKEMGQEESDEDGADDIWVPTTVVKMADAGMPMDGTGMNDLGVLPNKKVDPKKIDNGSGKDTGKGK